MKYNHVNGKKSRPLRSIDVLTQRSIQIPVEETYCKTKSWTSYLPGNDLKGWISNPHIVSVHSPTDILYTEFCGGILLNELSRAFLSAVLKNQTVNVGLWRLYSRFNWIFFAIANGTNWMNDVARCSRWQCLAIFRWTGIVLLGD